MASIHYKFAASKSYSSVLIDGIAVSLKDLKELISEAKSLPKSSDMDLVISNAQTGEGKLTILCAANANHISRTL